MKRQSILLISACMLLCVNKILSQNADSLDKKNGFKEFKLGDSYSKWSSQINYVDSHGETRYKYIGTCCREVFSTAVDDIYLIFAQDKLVLITIFLKPYQDFRKENKPVLFQFPQTDYQKLVNTFESLFGASQEVVPNEKSSEYYSNVWTGKKVILNTFYIFKGNYDYSGITIMDKVYFDKKKSNGF